MKLDSCFRRLLCAALLIGATGVASAQSAGDESAVNKSAADSSSADISSGFYVGTFAGLARYPSHAFVNVGSLTLVTTDSREHDMSWGFMGGYRFGRYIAIEGGYVDLGSGTAKLMDMTGRGVSANMRFAARGETLAFAGILPFGSRWEASLKLGMLYNEVAFTLNGTQFNTPFGLSSSSKGTLRLYQEAALSYRFDEHWKTSLTVSHFPNLGEINRTGQVSLLNTSLGLYYQF